MRRGCPMHWRRVGRVDQRLGKTPLILQRQAYDVRFRNSLLRSVVCGCHDENAHAAALDLGGALHDGACVRRDSGFEASGESTAYR
jgi:hypothetical protein